MTTPSSAPHLEARAEVDGRRPRPRQRDLFMTWDQARALIASGMSVGSHTHRHRNLAPVTMNGQRAELAGSKRILEEELNVPISALAYPYGWPAAFDASTCQTAREDRLSPGVLIGRRSEPPGCDRPDGGPPARRRVRRFASVAPGAAGPLWSVGRSLVKNRLKIRPRFVRSEWHWHCQCWGALAGRALASQCHPKLYYQTESDYGPVSLDQRTDLRRESLESDTMMSSQDEFYKSSHVESDDRFLTKTRVILTLEND